MSTRYRVLFLACLFVAEVVAAQGQPPSRTAVATDTVEVRIGLPEGPIPTVSVTFGEGGLSLSLPKGAAFPLDIVAASHGLVRRGDVFPEGENRVRLDLKLAGALLDGIAYEPTAVVLKLHGRSSAVASGGGGMGRYTLGQDDKIQLTIAGHPEYSRQLVVGQNGTISAPLVGEVKAEGITPQELAARLTDLLARDYLVDPLVDVEVVEYKSQWVMVAGEVKVPGRVALRGGSTLKDVLSDAGGLNMDAGEIITISRETTPGAEPRTITVPKATFESGETNPELFPGDMVNVKSATYAYIRGEVRNPGRVRVELGLTLLKALAIVGDLTEWADRKSVQVLREKSQTPAKAYNLKAIESGKEADPVLEGGEIVIVKRRFL
jgi:polysaccharide export outer membrane protein